MKYDRSFTIRKLTRAIPSFFIKKDMPDLSLADAYARCEALSRSHYENFPVARLVPKAIRPHVSAVYAFARTADDIADEAPDDPAQTNEVRLAGLARMNAQLDAVESGAPLDAATQWIFLPVAHTLKKFDIPVQLFRDLLSAFAQDVTLKRYETFADVLDYCRRSANPVGRLVLLLHGFRDDERFAMSDAICTALQLANFWQDVAVDWKKNRIYIPAEDRRREGVEESDFAAPLANESLRRCLRFQVERTQQIFDMGRPLPGTLPFPLSIEIRATWYGGAAILQKIAAQDFDTLAGRPAIGTWDKIRLLFKALLAK